MGPGFLDVLCAMPSARTVSFKPLLTPERKRPVCFFYNGGFRAHNNFRDMISMEDTAAGDKKSPHSVSHSPSPEESSRAKPGASYNIYLGPENTPSLPPVHLGTGKE